jgi:uncharacterized protein YqjF (DUF2071 family)
VNPDDDFSLAATEHRPYPLPAGRWRMRQRWNDLLFAHWPIPVAEIAALLPAGLEVDTFEGYAWAGVVPFWMDEVTNRVVGSATVTVPTTRTFPELNLRTYVRSRVSGLSGVYFFSLDCASPLAVLGARTLFHLPYFPASMSYEEDARGIHYKSRRRLTRKSVRFEGSYRSLGAAPVRANEPGSIEHFLTERYCLFTPFAGHMLVGDIHHVAWPLEPAEAEIRVNEIPAAHEVVLPKRAPVLHFARELRVTIWPLRRDV